LLSRAPPLLCKFTELKPNKEFQNVVVVAAAVGCRRVRKKKYREYKNLACWTHGAAPEKPFLSMKKKKKNELKKSFCVVYVHGSRAHR